MELYQIQVDQGLYFLHEHPDGASSWKNTKVQKIANTPGVYRVKGDMCTWDMKQEDEQGEGVIRKRTGFMTNSQELAKGLEKKCVMFIDTDSLKDDVESVGLLYVAMTRSNASLWIAAQPAFQKLKSTWQRRNAMREL